MGRHKGPTDPFLGKTAYRRLPQRRPCALLHLHITPARGTGPPVPAPLMTDFSPYEDWADCRPSPSQEGWTRHNVVNLYPHVSIDFSVLINVEVVWLLKDKTKQQ